MASPISFQLSAPIPRDDLEQDADQIFPIPLKDVFIFDSGASLGTAGASDDLGFYQGTHGTHFPYIGTGDVKASTTQRKARLTFLLPHNYVADGALYLRLHAGMVTTVAGTSALVDAAAYKAHSTTGALKSGSDLVTTTQQDMNSLTWENIDFALEPTGLVPGDMIDVLITIDVVDAATATAVIAGFRPFFGCTVRG